MPIRGGSLPPHPLLTTAAAAAGSRLHDWGEPSPFGKFVICKRSCSRLGLRAVFRSILHIHHVQGDKKARKALLKWTTPKETGYLGNKLVQSLNDMITRHKTSSGDTHLRRRVQHLELRDGYVFCLGKDCRKSRPSRHIQGGCSVKLGLQELGGQIVGKRGAGCNGITLYIRVSRSPFCLFLNCGLICPQIYLSTILAFEYSITRRCLSILDGLRYLRSSGQHASLR